MKYIIATDIEEFGCKQTMYVKIEEGIVVFAHKRQDATQFSDLQAQAQWRSLECHNCEEPYYIIEAP